MERVEQDKTALISGIEQDAHREAETILKEAEQLAHERRVNAEQQIASILKDAENKAAAQIKTMEKKLLSGIDIEIKRNTMHIRDILLKEILEAVEKNLTQMASGPSWRSTLLNWAVEATVGLGASSAEINASAAERALLDKAFCTEAETRAGKIIGQTVSLIVSDKPPLLLPGIVVTADTGKTAFNNQIHTRLVRKMREIRHHIYKTMFPEIT